MKKVQTVLSGALKREFQKDLELFKHFLLLLNDAGPIRNVELMWNDEIDPSKPKFKNRVGTGDALVQLQPAGSNSNRNSPSTLFCDLVHGFSAHEEETCARSDVPAQQRCCATGCSQVYDCHVGLTDIAVPVVCDDQYLGTLFSGQVLTHPPTAEGFKLVRAALTDQKHIDFARLEAAYYQVPVVEPGEVAEMVRMLELFARYISNSWKRLQIIGEAQRRQDRELTLDRKELAAILLSGEIGDRQELSDLSRRAGLQRLPDRVLVVQLKYLESQFRTRVSDQISLNRLSHILEDLCQGWPNTLATVVRPGEVCVFTSLEARNRGHERISLQELAEAVLAHARSHGGVTGRVGISAEHRQVSEMLDAYQEACAALDEDSVSVSFFADPASTKAQPADALGRLVKAIRKGMPAPAAMHDLLAHAMPTDHSAAALHQSTAFLTWAIEHLALEVTSVGANPQQVTPAKEKAISGVLHAPTPFSACEAFRRFADLLTQQISSTFSQREHKIVLRIAQLVEEQGAAHITIQDLANALHLSAGHLSRVFRRTTGTTLEQFLIQQRVELAKRTLLDPRLNVAEVAERCGFCNPAYFASVFKKYVQCTPREFASQPHPWAPAAAGSPWPGSLPNSEPAQS